MLVSDLKDSQEELDKSASLIDPEEFFDATDDASDFIEDIKCDMPPPIKRVCSEDLRGLKLVEEYDSPLEKESKDELELSETTIEETTMMNNSQKAHEGKVVENFFSEIEKTINHPLLVLDIRNVTELFGSLTNDEIADQMMKDLDVSMVEESMNKDEVVDEDDNDDGFQENGIENNDIDILSKSEEKASEDKTLVLDEEGIKEGNNQTPPPTPPECTNNELNIEPVDQVKITPFPLPFLKSYSTVCGKLTFNELEQLVLEKIAEVIVYRSDNRELQAKQEKQVKIIESLQQRLTHVTRQYSDMEIIHNQVLKDLEQRNGGIVVPVKITRAVGLQVYQPVNRKFQNVAQTTSPAKATQKRPAEEPPKVDLSPPTMQNIKRKAIHKITPMRPPLTDREKANLEIEEQKEEQQIRINAIKHIVNKVPKIILPSNITVTPITVQNPMRTIYVPEENSTGRVMLSCKQVNPTKPENSNTSIDLTDDIEDGTNGTAQEQPPALVAFRGNSSNSKGKTKPKTSFYVEANSTLNKSIDKNVAVTTSRAKQTPGPTHSHPAPLPSVVSPLNVVGKKKIPPRPSIRISNDKSGIIISWTVDLVVDVHAEIHSYQIYAYEETSAAPSTENWRHVGDVKALLLPMAVTLTQFQEGQTYHFAVRAIDIYKRMGIFSQPKTWNEK
ncbi:unnamed protein product [Diamesa serratosioi]